MMAVMIIFLVAMGSGNGSGAGVAVGQVEFATMETCEAARPALPQEVKSHAGEWPATVRAVCVVR